MRNILYSFVLLVSLVAVGCQSKESVFPVSGTVMLKGKPLQDCGVSFNRVGGGVSAHGVTDMQGRFQLKTLEDAPRNGAVPGEYAVYLRWHNPNPSSDSSDDSEPSPPFRLPPNAVDGSTKFTVPAKGTDQAIFEF